MISTSPRLHSTPINMNAIGTKPAANGMTVIVCVCVWLAFSIAVFVMGPYDELVQLSGGQLLEERFGGYDAPMLAAQLDKIGARGRVLYGQFQALDGANAILMAIALSLLIALAVRSVADERSWLSLLALLPVAAGVLELVENAALLDALGSYPAAGAFVGEMGRVTQVKLFVGFTSLLLAALSVIVLGVATLAQRLRRT